MPIDFQEVKKAIKEYRREVTEVKHLGVRDGIIDFISWVERNGKTKTTGKTQHNPSSEKSSSFA